MRDTLECPGIVAIFPRGHFPDWIVARLGVMEFLASGHGDTALANDQTFLRGIQHIDAGPRNPASFVLCDQLLQA